MKYDLGFRRVERHIQEHQQRLGHTYKNGSDFTYSQVHIYMSAIKVPGQNPALFSSLDPMATIKMNENEYMKSIFSYMLAFQIL